MPKFKYNGIVKVKPGADASLMRGRAWVVGIFEDRPGPYFSKFPEGAVYTIEFEDGSSTEVHEGNLEAANLPQGTEEDVASLPPTSGRGQAG